MRTLWLFTVATIITICAHGQSDYSAKLSEKVDEIRKMIYYDTDVVLYGEEQSVAADIPIWTASSEYKSNDSVSHNRFVYQALTDSKGEDPELFPNKWKMVSGQHPYFFLRDSTTTEDLQKLLSDENRFVKCYAVGALARKKYPDLFNVVLENLMDTTTMVNVWKLKVHPADIMTWYALPLFSSQQKDMLKKLVIRDYTHLFILREVLVHHRPNEEDYPYIKKLLSRPQPQHTFVLVALSTYCKAEDFEIIRKGFDMKPVLYLDCNVFFRAIESCPDKTFKNQLLHVPQLKEYYWFMDFVDEAYVSALAGYKDAECLEQIKSLMNAGGRSEEISNAIIYRSLMKHYDKMYDPLLRKLKRKLKNTDPYQVIPNEIDKSPWNY
jgi:hypothetical protein